MRLGTTVSSAITGLGDRWRGTVSREILIDDRVAIPAGSEVEGVVTNVQDARDGLRGLLDLSITSISVTGNPTSMRADSEPIIAGSLRAQNLGTDPDADPSRGGAHGSGVHAVAVGGILGAALHSHAGPTANDFQVTLGQGTTLSFTVIEALTLR
ncbi:MAG TPA: hypothetical protein VEY91_01060 [Candidatus Limnocylindria bacterium]|nr:hypothetical protein [Candidatus Limnocylindria bacterium]